MSDAPHTEGGFSGTVHSSELGVDPKHAKDHGKHTGKTAEPAAPPMSGSNLVDPVTGEGHS